MKYVGRLKAIGLLANDRCAPVTRLKLVGFRRKLGYAMTDKKKNLYTGILCHQLRMLQPILLFLLHPRQYLILQRLAETPTPEVKLFALVSTPQGQCRSPHLEGGDFQAQGRMHMTPFQLTCASGYL
jgi:hypothetical protein